MFSLFSSSRVKALEDQNAMLIEKIEKLQEAINILENEVRDIDIQGALENAVENIDFSEMASDAIEEVINNASLSVRF